MEYIEAYKDFLKKGKTERECVVQFVKMAEDAGYKNLDAVESVKSGDKVYITKFGKAISLFQIGTEPIEKGMNILGAHVDSPRIDVKQNPLYEAGEFTYLDTHYYGGIKKYQWTAIPLAIHGVVAKKDGSLTDFQPTVYLFGAKSAPGYARAKAIIRYINRIAKMINNDPAVSDKLKVVFVQNYNCSYAEHIIPAADVSEQISPAGTEASGTGNMKLMLNGAVTLGTLDGANVEIAELVGPENIYTFGLSSEAVINSYARGDYDPAAYLEADPRLKAALDFLVCDEMRTMGDAARLERLHAELQNKDCFMTFPDFADYCATKARMLADLGDEAAWARKALVNIAMAGYFSSDRTIRQYVDEIWRLEKIHVEI